MWDLKENKVVINRDVIFDEKAKFQNTHKEEKQTLKNHDSHECVVQVEQETRGAITQSANDANQNAGRASIKDQQPYSRGKSTIKPPTRYGFEDLVSYALIPSSGDTTNF